MPVSFSRWYRPFAAAAALVLASAVVIPATALAAEEPVDTTAPTTSETHETTIPEDENQSSETDVSEVPNEEDFVDETDGVESLATPEESVEDEVDSQEFTITPFATSTTMDVIVRKRLQANPTTVSGSEPNTIGSVYTGTVGATFELYTYTNYNAGPQQPTGYKCTITSGGQCTIVIPNANTTSGNGNYGKQFWVVEIAPVADSEADLNTYSNPRLLVGSYQGPTGIRHIVGLTQTVQGNRTNTMPMAANTSSGSTAISNAVLGGGVSTAQGASFGAVANSWNNPKIQPKCEVEPLRISLVLDQSASITGSQWTTFRNALVGTGGVLGQLRDAGAQVSILGFGSSVTGTTGDNRWHFGASGPTTLPANYSSYIPTSRPGGGTNATNWDAALSTIEAVNDTHDYDLVLFITDGAPNFILNGTQVSSYDVTLRSLEAPIYAANALKQDGTRVVAVGVGAGITGAGPNLRAISGETLNSDYFQTTDWDLLQKQLTEIVQAATCQLPVEVSKTTVDDDDNTVVNAGNWQFNASSAGSGSSLIGTPTQTTSSGEAGTANWTVRFTQPSGQTASVTLTETLKDDWVLESVQCSIAGGPLQDQTIVDGNKVTITGLTTASEKLYCVFTNTQTPQTGEVTWTKVDAEDGSLLGGSVWSITGGDFPASGTSIDDCVAASASECVGLDKDPAAGQFNLKDLPWGTYTVTETAAPTNYVLSNPANSFEFTVDAQNAGTVIEIEAQENDRETGSVIWSKVDPNGTALSGSSWTLEGPDGQSVTIEDCIVTTPAECTWPDKDPVAGGFLLENLAWGVYTLSENEPPAGFQISAETKTFEVGPGGENVQLTWDLGEFVNTPINPGTLPLTGSFSGMLPYIGGLSLLTVLAAAFYILRRKERNAATLLDE